MQRVQTEAQRERMRETTRLWNLLHPEKQREYRRRYRERNPHPERSYTPEQLEARREKERLRALNRTDEQRAARRESERLRGDTRTEAQRAAKRETDRLWRQAHPEKAQEKRERRRALKKGAAEIEIVSRAAIIARDKAICHICQRKVAKKDMTLDHLIPLSKGGPHTSRNLAVAHRSCNSRRGAGRLPAQLRLIS